MIVPIPRFTPSLLSHADLEELFVARTELLIRLMDRVTDAANGPVRNHTLLVGARGAGKTHLTSLVYHRTRELIDAGAVIQVAWLPEDPWTVASYPHFLKQIVQRIEPEAIGEPEQDEQGLEVQIVRAARARGPIVVLAENFDRVLNQMGTIGQQRLRSLLHREDALLIIATTTRLDRSLAVQNEPFYGFFTTTKLAPLTVSEAREMLQRLATRSGDTALADRLANDEHVNARLRTIAHLAGGQPRLWAALGSALTIDQLDDLVELLLTRFDDLTPYYQEQLSQLSPHQRLIVAELADLDRPVHVADLAERLGLPERSVGKSASDLVELGWIAPTASPFVARLDRRRTYYELAEPLARLAFQIKESRGKPLRLIVDFLKAWFDPTDIVGAAGTSSSEAYLAAALREFESDAVTQVVRRLTRLTEYRAPALALLEEADLALAALSDGNVHPFMELPVAVRTALETRIDETSAEKTVTQARIELHTAALDEMGAVPHPASSAWLKRSATLNNSDEGQSGLEIYIRWLIHDWQFEDARALLDPLLPELTVDSRLTVLDDLAAAYLESGRADEAIVIYEDNVVRAQRDLDPDSEDVLNTRNSLAVALNTANRPQDAAALLEQNLASRERTSGASHPSTLTSRNNLANVLVSMGEFDRAVSLLHKNLEIAARTLGPRHSDTMVSRSSLAYAVGEQGDFHEAHRLNEQTYLDRELILGRDHPDILASRNNLAYYSLRIGDVPRAIELYSSNLSDRERILGPDHPDTITSRQNLGAVLEMRGDIDEAVPILERALLDSRRVLGAQHPDTIDLELRLRALTPNSPTLAECGQ